MTNRLSDLSISRGTGAVSTAGLTGVAETEPTIKQQIADLYAKQPRRR